MSKKAYMAPETTKVAVAPQQMMIVSGESSDGIKVHSEADDSDDPTRSRISYDCWEDEQSEEEEY